MRRPSVLAASLIGTIALFACERAPSPTEEWTPADHGQPPRSAVDPSRVARPSEEAARPGTARQRAIAALYQVHCARCHGGGGAGDGPGRTAMMQLPDFSSPEWQSSLEDAQIVEAIRLGKGMMPGFGEQIDDEGIAALLSHVRAFGEGRDAEEPEPTHSADGGVAPTLNPRSR